jgi:hypothetical protein
MKFNTEVTVISPTTGERTKWQGPQIEAETFQQAEKAAFNAIVYATGENVPREQLSVNMQPPRSLAFVMEDIYTAPQAMIGSVLNEYTHLWLNDKLSEETYIKTLRLIGYEVFNPKDPETIRKRNENLFHPDFVSKLNEAEAIGGVVISYLPEV